MGVDTTLEIPVPAQDTHGNKVGLFHCRGDSLGEGSAVPDACHTAVAHQVETVGSQGREGGEER